jgi:hypothetical protein
MRSRFLAVVVFKLAYAPTEATIACSMMAPNREPTVAEQVAGLKIIFGGTVVGYVTSDGVRHVGSLPSQCLDDAGDFDWWDDPLLSACAAYLDTEAALFRVDVPIVGPAANEIVEQYMTWGDGDCNIDFRVGDEWLIAGDFTQELLAPIRDDEVALLQRLASRPSFDVDRLYR